MLGNCCLIIVSFLPSNHVDFFYLFLRYQWVPDTHLAKSLKVQKKKLCLILEFLEKQMFVRRCEVKVVFIEPCYSSRFNFYAIETSLGFLEA